MGCLNVNIYVNSLIEYRDQNLNTTSIDRILWISSDKEKIVVIKVNQKDKPIYPEFKLYQEVIEAFILPLQ